MEKEKNEKTKKEKEGAEEVKTCPP